MFPQDKLPKIIFDKNTNYFAIVNTDTYLNTLGQKNKGTHWVAVAGIPNKNNVLVYDSFGRDSRKLLPLIYKSGITIDTDYDAEQKKIQDSCGQFSLAWLCVVELIGYKLAKLI